MQIRLRWDTLAGARINLTFRCTKDTKWVSRCFILKLVTYLTTTVTKSGLRSGLRISTSDDYLDHTYRTAMDWGADSETTHENGFAYQSYGMSTLYGEYDDYLGGVAETG